MIVIQGQKTRVEFEFESILQGTPARVLVYEDDELLIAMVGVIIQVEGADGRRYPAVKFKTTCPEKPICS